MLVLFFQSQLSAQVYINEICPANADVNVDTDFYNFSGWVELYNAGTNSVNLGGYYLSDKSSDRAKWRVPNNTVIPSKGHLLIWCDEANQGLHTNFGLDAEGEEVVLSNAALVLVDKIDFPVQYTNISYGRTHDGGSNWTYLLNPTPKNQNNSAFASSRLSKPSFSLLAGRHSGPQSLSLKHSNSHAEIRYTLDGSEPTASSLLYTSSISISSTTIVKAKAFLEGFVPSQTVSNTYFINQRNFSLPVVSISTRPDYLWDNTIGIYTDGSNGVSGNCTGALVNWNQDWDRHAIIELFAQDGSKSFDQAVDIRIGGACSRNNPQKSFVIKARDKYGDNVIAQKLFTTKGSNSYGGLIFRNSGNDFNVTMFRDALLQSLVIGQMDVDYLAYQPTIFYLNGQYWGIQNLREKIDADYIESNYGIKKDDIDLLESYGNALEGTSDAYWSYINTLESMDRSQEASFDFIDQHIDVQEYINYLSTEIYYANTDWPGNNQKFWRQRSTNGKFRWILWDLDFGFGIYQDTSYPTHPTLNFATDPNSGVGWPNPDWSTLPIRLVLDNPTFKTRFIQTLVGAMNTTFHPERVIGFIDGFQADLQTEMPYHKQRWGGDMNGWNYEVQRMRDFAGLRHEYMQQHISDFFGLGDRVRLDVSAEAGNTFKMNGVLADRPLEQGVYYKGLPYVVEAVPYPGYAFSHWQITERESAHVPMVAKGAVWKYADLGVDLGADWRNPYFNDGNWPEGPAQLGYGDGDEQTLLGFGPDANNKFITTYFRKTFELEDTLGLASLQASVLFDDGVVVYLNGTEVYRNNLPSGEVVFSTLANDFIANENAFVSFNLPMGLLVPGQNTVAVEIHQNSPQSSDISFDFSLSGSIIGEEALRFSQDILLIDTAQSDIVLQAFFETVPSYSGLVINEFCATSSFLTDEFDEEEDWIELYNSGSENIDLTGLYITDNLISRDKHQIKSVEDDQNILAPGEYKLLWADEDTHQGSLHLGFKLSAEGEQLGLYQQVGEILFPIDEVTFGNQSEGASYSRLPNASGPFITTSLLTPREENQFGEPLGMDKPLLTDLVIYPNPTQGLVSIKSGLPITDLKIYDGRGQLIKSYVHLGNNPEVSLEGLKPGLYLLLVKSADQTVAKRIVRY